MRTTITAHSGCEQTPNDSLESIHKATGLGADLVEVDVRRDHGGRLVISHDKRDDYRDRPFLEEAFRLVLAEPSLSINCDMKEGEAIGSVLELADQVGLIPGRLAFSGNVLPSLLYRQPDIAKRANIYINIEELVRGLILEELPEQEREKLLEQSAWTVLRERGQDNMLEYVDVIARTCRKLQVKALNLPVALDKDGLYDRLEALEVPLSVWEVNDPDKIQELLHRGVKNITTRAVETALALRNQQDAREK